MMFLQLYDVLTKQSAHCYVIEHPAEGVSDNVAQVMNAKNASFASLELAME